MSIDATMNHSAEFFLFCLRVLLRSRLIELTFSAQLSTELRHSGVRSENESSDISLARTLGRCAFYGNGIMTHDMVYDGKRIAWLGRGIFKATSGLPGFQLQEHACAPDSGPIPQGRYHIFISDMGTAADDGSGYCALKPSWGIQKIPRGSAAGRCEPNWANWGMNRARMEPSDAATKMRCHPVVRGGFYLHDSTKGFSHGCIEVETRLFSLLRNVAKSTRRKALVIKISYLAGASTNGGTKA